MWGLGPALDLGASESLRGFGCVPLGHWVQSGAQQVHSGVEGGLVRSGKQEHSGERDV